MSFHLPLLGWDPSREEEFEPHAAEGLVPARVAAQHRGAYLVYAEAGERTAEVAGRLRHAAATGGPLPAVGDWVAVGGRPGSDAVTVEHVLARRTVFSRKAAGEATVEQVVAANVDVVFLVTAFGGDLNLRRLERYLAAGWESGARPVVVLNKSDLADDVEAEVAQVEAVAFGVPVHAVTCVAEGGADELVPYLGENRTVALLGSSGVGKSSLVNRLLGHERQQVSGLRSDGRGRHTTTHRELLPVPDGGLVLDTPGMRVLGLWNAEAGMDSAFEDVAALAAECRFADCRHEREPGCAVRAALESGRLEPARLESYRKLERELHRLDVLQDGRLRSEARRERRRFARSMRKASW